MLLLIAIIYSTFNHSGTFNTDNPFNNIDMDWDLF